MKSLIKILNHNEKGITLISLVVTIVVLLILAGITIGIVTSDDGLIKNANDAKEQTEISNEKEIIDEATLQAMGNNKRGNLVQDELQEQLDKITGAGKTEADDVGEEFEIAFVESKRYYTVDKNGTVTGPQKIVIDKSPGDITKNENGEDLDGTTKDTAYQIWCIEDLVEYSKLANSASAYTLADKYIKLCTTLNFKSKLSYADYETAIYDEFLGGDGTTKLIEQLSESGKGFYPINGGPNKNTSIAKEFDGQGFKIENIYINQEEDAGFIGNATNICVKNLTITGTIISQNESAGGICGNLHFSKNNISIIDNCYNYATVKSYSSDSIFGSAGGFIGYGSAIITNSSNYGEIIAENYAGGLSGTGNGFTVINCTNFGSVTSNPSVAGGILGLFNSAVGEVNIYNSYNTGKISGQTNAGGIIGVIYASAKIKNVYNIGQIESTTKTPGAIIGGALWNNPDTIIQYCYYLNNVEKGIGQTIPDTTTKYQNNIMTSLDFSNELNENIKKIQTDGTDISKWRNWVSGNEGYPILNN